MTAPTLHRLLNLDMAEAVFGQLLQTLDNQAKQLVILQEEVAKRATKKDIERMSVDFDSRISSVEGRLMQIEKEIHVPESRNIFGSSGGSIGYHVGEHTKALEWITAQIYSKADKRELEDEAKRIDQTLLHNTRALKLWAMDRRSGEDLLQTQSAQHQELSSVQYLLSTKLDRSEAAHIQTLLTKAGQVAEFFEDTAHRLDVVEEGVKEAQDSDRAHLVTLEKIKRDIQQTTVVLNTKADTTSLDDIANELSNLQNTTTICEEQSMLRDATLGKDISELRKQAHGLTLSLEGLKGDLEKKTLEIDTSLRRSLDTKVDITACDAIWAEIRSELVCKAWSRELSLLNKRVDTLAQEHSKTARQAGLACRFVDWFSSRGKAYEHNLNAVERQIETLALNSMPANRQPFDGRVRFTATNT